MGKEQGENLGFLARTGERIVAGAAVATPGVVVGGAVETFFGYRPADIGVVWITLMSLVSVISVGTGFLYVKKIIDVQLDLPEE